MTGTIASGFAVVLVLIAANAARASDWSDWNDRNAVTQLPGALVARDAVRGVTYTLTPIVNGVHLSGEAPQLQFHKTVHKDGHIELQIASDGDSVSLAVNAFRIEATRGKQTVTIGTNGASSEELASARALLAGSPAVRRYRRLAEALEASRTDSPASYAVLIGAAVVEALGGDQDAPLRIARRLSRSRVASLRATSGKLRGVRMEECWDSYEVDANNAMNDYVACLGSAANAVWFLQPGYVEMCSIGWVLQAEGYWLGYMQCLVLPPAEA